MSKERMPLLFVGHGSPMNAVEDNEWSRGFKALSSFIPRPKAILAVSAHWFVEGLLTTSNDYPRTIHDFYGFPEELYGIRYQAPGSLALSRRATGLLSGFGASESLDWGLDHGAWSVLRHLYPKADIPIVQLSLDSRLPPVKHLEIASSLKPLRDEGVLILGSGNAVHNLGYVFANWSDKTTPDWAQKFDEEVKKAFEGNDLGFFSEALHTKEGRMSHPTPDHYLPMLYAAGAADKGERASFPLEGFDMGSLSMRAALIG